MWILLVFEGEREDACPVRALADSRRTPWIAAEGRVTAVEACRHLYIHSCQFHAHPCEMMRIV
jgi:hypothetical protein